MRTKTSATTAFFATANGPVTDHADDVLGVVPANDEEEDEEEKDESPTGMVVASGPSHGVWESCCGKAERVRLGYRSEGRELSDGSSYNKEIIGLFRCVFVGNIGNRIFLEFVVVYTCRKPRKKNFGMHVIHTDTPRNRFGIPDAEQNGARVLRKNHRAS